MKTHSDRDSIVWQGPDISPQGIYDERAFHKAVLDPPTFEPGSWRGAGNCIKDEKSGLFWLVTRPRTRESRGYCFESYSSKSGDNFSLRQTMTREELSQLVGDEVLSIEGQQLLRDPLSDRYYLYLAVDIGLKWQTALLSSDDPLGPWRFEGLVLRRDRDYDSFEARDATVGIVGGRYLAIYKASDGNRVNAALAVSSDGKTWDKRGLLKLGGQYQPEYHFLCGNIVPSEQGPLFIGFESADVLNKAATSKRFVSYLVDEKAADLLPVFLKTWKPLSPFERTDFPIHSYGDLVHDPDRNRLLFFVEAIDPKHSAEVGLNLEVDRVLLYTVDLS